MGFGGQEMSDFGSGSGHGSSSAKPDYLEIEFQEKCRDRAVFDVMWATEEAQVYLRNRLSKLYDSMSKPHTSYPEDARRQFIDSRYVQLSEDVHMEARSMFLQQLNAARSMK